MKIEYIRIRILENKGDGFKKKKGQDESIYETN